MPDGPFEEPARPRRTSDGEAAPHDACEDAPVASDGPEREAALAAFLRAQAQKAEAEERASVARRQRSASQRIGGLLLALAAAVWVWVFPPAWLQTPRPEPPTLAEESSALRLTMYFQAQKIEGYRREYGRVPLRLEDAGPPFAGMEYIRLTDADYRLRGRAPRVTLSFSSAGDDVAAFLGDAEDLLEWRKLQ